MSGSFHITDSAFHSGMFEILCAAFVYMDILVFHIFVGASSTTSGNFMKLQFCETKEVLGIGKTSDIVDLES